MNENQRTERAVVALVWRYGNVTPPIFIHNRLAGNFDYLPFYIVHRSLMHTP